MDETDRVEVPEREKTENRSDGTGRCGGGGGKEELCVLSASVPRKTVEYR